MDNEKIIITIEGNIGVGKSTFINILKKNWDDCEVVSEPVDMWLKLVNDDGKNMLDTFYSDINRWAYSFQNTACITRMMKIEETLRTSPNKYIFLDRSLETDYNVFEKMLFDSNMINKLEHEMYLLWYNFYWNYVRNKNSNKSIHIYLKCDADIALDRIKKRGRIEENSISIEYLNDLNKYHDNWLLTCSDNVIIIDCNEDFENNIDKQQVMMQLIKDKLNEIMINQNIISKNKKCIEIVTDKSETIFNSI
jgi:deoxyadenosine/deoxycytidine kinase